MRTLSKISLENYSTLVKAEIKKKVLFKNLTILELLSLINSPNLINPKTPNFLRRGTLTRRTKEIMDRFNFNKRDDQKNMVILRVFIANLLLLRKVMGGFITDEEFRKDKKIIENLKRYITTITILLNHGNEEEYRKGLELYISYYEYWGEHLESLTGNSMGNTNTPIYYHLPYDLFD